MDLAACVLAISQHVGGVLAKQTPRLGAIEEQARAAFEAESKHWLAMVLPAARDAVALAPDGQRSGLARAYAADLGAAVDTAAAAALAAGMDSQLAKGQHPDVAWQRVVAGYGLDRTAMRSYIARAATASLTTAKLKAQQALLAQVDRVGNREVSAWADLPAGTAVAKAFDPQQRRDEDGKWTAGQARVKDREADGVDELLAQVPVDSAQPGRYAGVGRYAPTDRYAGSRYADRYATAPLTTPGRYPTGGRYTRPDRYAEPVRDTVVNRQIYLFGAIPPDEKPPPPPAAEKTHTVGLYVPMADVNDFYYDYATQQVEVPRDTVSFEAMTNHYRQTRGASAKIELREDTSPWRVAPGMDGIDDNDWSDILQKAVPLWHSVMEDPMDYAAQLDPTDLSIIAERAGYPGVGSKQALLDRIQRLVDMRDRGQTRIRNASGVDTFFDNGLLMALADYVVWNKPEEAGEAGAGLERELEHRLDRDELDATPVPAVMTFDKGLHLGEDRSDLQGRYFVTYTEYQSGIGTWGHGVPAGKIALVEHHLEPTRPKRLRRV